MNVVPASAAPFSWPELTGGLAVAVGILLIILIVQARRLRHFHALLEEEKFHRQSLSSTYGRITEQWFPLLGEYPYNPQEFRFLGSPVDGVQFEEDRIVFIEFKANKSRLSEKQRRIKKLVEDGDVYWEEFHFTDSP